MFSDGDMQERCLFNKDVECLSGTSIIDNTLIDTAREGGRKVLFDWLGLSQVIVVHQGSIRMPYHM